MTTNIYLRNKSQIFTRPLIAFTLLVNLTLFGSFFSSSTSSSADVICSIWDLNKEHSRVERVDRTVRLYIYKYYMWHLIYT